ncbi:MAG: baseplate J/gp47 family protein [Acidobacteria bacterium]|nr:baseplate J/gp47 family protein [Acidobacteriota bacterium]
MTAFAPRSFEAITEAMAEWIASDPDLSPGSLPTDLSVGSLERSHLEALAVVLEEYEVRTAEALSDAIRRSCYHAFGFGLLPPRKAKGTAVFVSFTPAVRDIPIPKGSRIQADGGGVFETVEPGLIPHGAAQSEPIPVEALEPGPKGNLPAGALQRLVLALPGVDLVTNPSPTMGGAAEESEELRAERFSQWIRTLVRGTKEALEFAALGTGAVLDARCVEPYLLDPVPPGVPYAGLVWLFVDEGLGNGELSPTARLAVERAVNGFVDAGGDVVPGWKAAGIPVRILAAHPVPVCLRARVQLAVDGSARWDEISELLTETARRFFRALRIGEAVSYQNLVTALSLADPDIREVDLCLWRSDQMVPAYAAPLSAEDLTPRSTDPLSVGARARLLEGSGAGLDGRIVTYPEWIPA